MDINNTRIYKVYHYLDTADLDMSKFVTPYRWSNDGEYVILEFKEIPHGNTQTLNHQEAVALMNTPIWRHDL